MQGVGPRNDRASVLLGSASGIRQAFRKCPYPAFAGRHRGNEAMAADPLSDLLKTVRLTGAVFFEIVAEDPWAVGSPAREQILPKILPGADHLIAYLVI